jgi:outer membrane immunogenic protein
MKKILLSTVALASMAGSAFAADLPSRKAPVAPPPVAPLWTGFHVGLNAGGIWNNNNSINLQAWPLAGQPIQYWAPLNNTISSGSNGGFIGGGQIGYDYQANLASYSIVTGIEADFQGTASGSGNGSKSLINDGPLVNALGPMTTDTILNNINGSANLSWIGTVRGRLGFLLMPNLLVYGTGGLAYGQVNLNVNQSQFQNVVFPGGSAGWAAFGNSNTSNTLVGYSAGGGLEWMFMPNWSAKAEYLYYDLGNLSTNITTTAIPQGLLAPLTSTQAWLSTRANTTVSGNIVRAGVNYHFNWGSAPVVAKY